jgi:hypothetical protein
MDLRFLETNNGGDFVKTAKDLVVIYGWENMPYLAMFGGNVEASTPTERLVSEQAFDWWGNELLMPNEPSIQFNSETERVLNTTPLTSAGRIKIQQAVINDLRFMKEFAKVAVAVSIISDDRVLIGVQIQEPDNVQKREFIFLWDATRGEIDTINNGSSSPQPQPSQNGFDYILDFAFI